MAEVETEDAYREPVDGRKELEETTLIRRERLESWMAIPE